MSKLKKTYMQNNKKYSQVPYSIYLDFIVNNKLENKSNDILNDSFCNIDGEVLAFSAHGSFDTAYFIEGVNYDTEHLVSSILNRMSL